MSLLFSRIVLTLIIGCVAYFALVRVWTKHVDLFALLKKPGESIPVKSESVSPRPVSSSENGDRKISTAIRLNNADNFRAENIRIVGFDRVVDAKDSENAIFKNVEVKK